MIQLIYYNISIGYHLVLQEWERESEAVDQYHADIYDWLEEAQKQDCGTDSFYELRGI